MNLYQLYMEYKDKDVDDIFINQAFELILKKDLELKPFIHNFKVVHMDDMNLGSYSNEDREICVNIDQILTADTGVKNKKLLAVEVIRHEMEHARNLQTLFKGRKDIESTIVGFSLKEYASEHGLDGYDYYDKDDFYILMGRLKKASNYLIDPGERLADIRAWKYIVNLLKNQRISDDLLVARSMLYYSYIRGYQHNRDYLDAPTYLYLIKMGMYHQYYLFKKRVEEQKNYSFETRLTYGLPLTEKEYDKSILRKVRLKKKDR